MKTSLMVTFLALLLVAGHGNAVELNPRGRIHLDYAAHDEDERDLDNGFELRRARLGLSGRIDDDWRYKIEYDFAGGSATAKDVYLAYTGFGSGTLTVGHFKIPFGLENLTSSNNISQVERSLTTAAFAHGRRLGVGFNGGGERWYGAFMVYADAIDSPARISDGGEDVGAGGRLTFNPVRSERQMVHLGFALSREKLNGEGLASVRFRTRPESRPTGVRLIDTDSIEAADELGQLGLEAAWQSGPYSIQGEWNQGSVDRGNGLENVDFDGWYVSGSWILTGESRGYWSGKFGGVTPAGEGGAWELVARYSSLDLDDGPIAGGEQRNWTLGANWYANSHVRLMANYINVRSSRQDVADDPGIFLLRAQVAF